MGLTPPSGLAHVMRDNKGEVADKPYPCCLLTLNRLCGLAGLFIPEEGLWGDIVV